MLKNIDPIITPDLLTVLASMGHGDDLVICDTPPLISVGDGVALAAQVDGVILVVQGGKVPHDVVRRVVEHVEAVKGRIVGVLLNRVDLRRDGYGYNYYRYYAAYYGVGNGRR